MSSDQTTTAPKGKAKQDRVPALKNPSVESRLGESSTASKNKPKWYQKVLDFAKRKAPADPRPDEDCTLYIGRPTEKARVDFRPGFGPYVIILHGEVSKCCEWWYLADHEIPRDEDRKRCDRIQLPELKIVYEWGKSEQFTCGKRVCKIKVGTVAAGVDREKFDRICLALGSWEDGNGDLLVKHVLNCAVDNGVLGEQDVYSALDKLGMLTNGANVWYATPPLLF
ncbi:hypothetical protein BJX68DRAFT_269147 [Aspergillus pseudodeflectus]|uniref:Uncharacterized protein n=1 Tax=Aspergillus pseudodeflectus TaxID=176178 RepID=A0ABR4JZY5_9EURO